MKKHFISIASAIFIAAVSSVYAAENMSFDTICAQLAQHPNTTGSFSQVKTINAAKRSLKSTGTFIFCLEGIVWKTMKPFPSTLIVGMKSVVQITPDGTKSVIDASNNQIFTSISTTLSSIFLGNTENIYKNFNINFTSENGRWNAVLTPKDKTVTAVMKSLSLGGLVSKSGTQFDTIVMTESGGNTITYTFTDQKYPMELSADEKANFTAQ
ncbi:MAG: outer membrane lipoprotein carrier protein LolA [Treponema sp.]|nr:outer membrane lipoprotein carrier protein LolA [Treponema sp.]